MAQNDKAPLGLVKRSNLLAWPHPPYRRSHYLAGRGLQLSAYLRERGLR